MRREEDGEGAKSSVDRFFWENATTTTIYSDAEAEPSATEARGASRGARRRTASSIVNVTISTWSSSSASAPVIVAAGRRARGELGRFRPSYASSIDDLRSVLYKSFSPIVRFQHLIASPFN
jgi:hypothetical protein